MEIHQWTMQNTEENMNCDTIAEDARSYAILSQPDYFESVGTIPDLNGVVSSQVRTLRERESESGNEECLEHVEAVVEEDNVETGNSANNDDEEEFREIVIGQNILKSNITHKFKCVCPCEPSIISDIFVTCCLHLHKKHRTTIVIPKEKCSLCNVQNLAVFKKEHTCDVRPRVRKNMYWRESSRYM